MSSIQNTVWLKDENGDLFCVLERERDAFAEEEATEEEITTHQDNITLDLLRAQREAECFSYINRGRLWYDTLTEEQALELQEWYQAWLDVTDTREIPTKPDWLA